MQLRDQHTRGRHVDVVDHDPATVGDHDRLVVQRTDGVSQALRVVALVAATIVTVIGLIALLRVEWSAADWDTPIVRVADLAFTPAVAGITAALGFVLIIGAALRSGTARIWLGAVLTTVGIVLVLAEGVESRWHVGDRHGWLAVGIGVVFLITGLLTDGRRIAGRGYG